VKGSHARWDDQFFQCVWRDILSTDTAKVTKGGEPVILEKAETIIRRICGERKARAKKEE